MLRFRVSPAAYSDSGLPAEVPVKAGQPQKSEFSKNLAASYFLA